MLLPSHRSGYLARSIQQHTEEQEGRCPKDCYAHDLSRATLVFRVGRIVVRKRQRPQDRKCKERRANIEQSCVWNAFDKGLAVFGAGEKAITMNDCVV